MPIRTCYTNCYINIDNRSFVDVTKFRYLRMMLTHRKRIHEGIKSISDLWIARYLSVQNVLSSVISKYVGIKTHRSV
jgi:hypothetical protein